MPPIEKSFWAGFFVCLALVIAGTIAGVYVSAWIEYLHLF